MHHVSVFDFVFFALEAPTTRVLCPSLTAKTNVVLKANNLGTDEAVLEVGVNDARSLRGFAPTGMVRIEPLMARQ